jgi:hypothetical protein
MIFFNFMINTQTQTQNKIFFHNSIHFGTEIKKFLEFLRPKKFLGF